MSTNLENMKSLFKFTKCFFHVVFLFNLHYFFSGFKLDNNTKQALVFKYSNEKSLVDFDSCLSCLSKLTQLFSK